MSKMKREWEERYAQDDNWEDDWEMFGECDTCGKEYLTYSREGRCGGCGYCAEHCDHI